MEENLQIQIKEVGADRGFDSASIQNWCNVARCFVEGFAN